ncbi:putative Fe-S oxidoreductase [Flammeovirgaceae bacterium 311]|nr:putative Fe-S oxidoreductase [Flammeovirgaceae bacterium 311]
MLNSTYPATAEEKHWLNNSEPAVIALEIGKKHPAPAERTSTIIYDKKQLSRVMLRRRFNVWTLALKQTKNPFEAYSIIQSIQGLTDFNLGKPVKKLVEVDGKYHTMPGSPAWPSSSFDQYIFTELNRLNKIKEHKAALRSMFLAVTDKNAAAADLQQKGKSGQKDCLSLEQLKTIVQKLQEEGVMQIQLGGGEPLLRFDEILELLTSARKGTDFWLTTSGQGLNQEKANALKEAGLVGVSLNLDHFDPDKYNTQRGYKHAYGWVLKAAECIRKAKLVLCLNLNATKGFVTEENLYKYARLAKKIGVSFINIIDPQTSLQSQQREEQLSVEQQKVLETFVETMNYEETYLDWPLVNYHCSKQQHTAAGAGLSDSFLYIDAKGDIHAGFNAKKKVGNVLNDRLPLSLSKFK